MNRRPRTLCAAAALAVLGAAGTLAPAGAAPLAAPAPRIVKKPIPFGAQRREEMAAYARRHYGLGTWALTPRVIVEHYTGSGSFSSAWNTFAADVPDSELHELPGTCAHFVIDTDGTIYQLVSLKVMCRHTVGLNYVAIGIEHVGFSDAQILGNARQMSASLRLTLWLMERYRINLGDVIGHNENRTSRFHKELYPAWRCQTHGDWTQSDMRVYRSRLRVLAGRYRVPLGAAVRSVRPDC